MPRKRTLAGDSIRCETPDWRPLIDLLMVDWMWMFAVELETGRRLEVYKHYETRRYLHLSADGHAYVFTNDDRYQEVDALWLLAKVLPSDADRPRDAEEVPGSA